MNDYVVRLNLKPSKDKEERKKLIDFCLHGDQQVLAIGWSYVYENGNAGIESYQDYYDAVKKRKGKLNPAHNFLRETTEGDLFWTRDLDGNYWICRAKGGAAPYCDTEKDIGAIIPVEAYKVGMQVAGQIKASFNRPNGGTAQKIDGELILQYSRYIFNKKCGRDIYEVQYIENDILSNLPDFDLEELVILYLQIKHNYCVLSNSIAKKSTTIKIECEMISRDVGDNSKAVVQVKGGKSSSIDAFEYQEYLQDGYTVYLYAPYIKNIEKVENVVEITPDELRSFYHEYKKILPTSITMWEDLFKS